MISLARCCRFAAFTLVLMWISSSCGGGSGNGMPAPSRLSYPSPAAFTINVAISALNPTVRRRDGDHWWHTDRGDGGVHGGALTR
jgi:hypothetical protein